MTIKDRIKQELTEWTTWMAALVFVLWLFKEPFWVDLIVIVGLLTWSPTRAEALIKKWAPKLQRGVDKASEVVGEIRKDI